MLTWNVGIRPAAEIVMFSKVEVESICEVATSLLNYSILRVSTVGSIIDNIHGTGLET